MTRAWAAPRSRSSPRRKAAVALFLLALAVFWFEALGWPMAKGRDTWDYLAYYLQLFDSDPPLDPSSRSSARRSRPSSLGVPAGSRRHRAARGRARRLYAVSIVAWSATALTFGRLPALLAALLLLGYPAFATLYHQASSDAIFATGLALWALGCSRARCEHPSGWRFAALGAGIAVLVLIRPANQVLLPVVLLPLLVPVPWRTRLVWSARCLAGRGRASWARGPCTTAFATTTRRSRAADARGSRSCASSWPTRRSRRRTATRPAARAPHRARGAAEARRTRASTSRSTPTSRTGRTTRPSA